MSTTTTTRGAALLLNSEFAARCKFLLDGLVVGQVIRVASQMKLGNFVEALDADLQRFARGPSKLGSGSKVDPRTWAHAMGYDWRPVAIRICQLNGIEL